MKILYINNEHCKSIDQLKGYFNKELNVGSALYADLLECGRYGDIAFWLQEQGLYDLAISVNAIDSKLCDSDYIIKLREVLTGQNEDWGIQKPNFEKTFEVQDVKTEVKNNEVRVRIQLKVLLNVNEVYEIVVRSDWGTKAEAINPYNMEDGKLFTLEYTLHKRTGKELKSIVIEADESELKKINFPKPKFRPAEFEEFDVNGIKFCMIRVEGGSFLMGEVKEYAQEITISDFMCCETPVTQALWKAVMGQSNNPSSDIGKEFPVENVSWYDCHEFIRQLNQKTGRVFRLLADAEWEYAARGGTKINHSEDEFYFSGSYNADEVAWYEGNSNGHIHEVRILKPNELGLYDMSGNVCEWCEDWYDPDHDYSDGTIVITKQPKGKPERVARGGSYKDCEEDCSVFSKVGTSPKDKFDFIGFRLALSVK